MPARNSYLEPESIRKILCICRIMRTFKNNESYPAQVYREIGDELRISRGSLASVMSRAMKFGFMVKVSGSIGTKIVYRCISHHEAELLSEELSDNYYRHMRDKSQLATNVRPKSKTEPKIIKPSLKDALSLMGKLNGVNHAS